MIAWTLFYNPMVLDAGGWTLWLVLPLCASVAIIYKTIRLKNINRLPQELLLLMGFMIVGLIALGVGLCLIPKVLP